MTIDMDTIDLLERPIEQHIKGLTHYENIVYYILQIGTGGTGSEVVRQLSQMLTTSNAKHVYVIADPDVISEKNIRNQIFLEEEVHELKADVLAERYSAAYPNLNIFSYTDGYIETVEDVQKLLKPDYLEQTGIRLNSIKEYLLPIIIGCVDNVYSRRQLADAFEKLPKAIYLDAGNESVIVPKDWTERQDRSLWSDEELKAYNESGWTGQVVCGVKFHRYYQPSVIDALILPENENTLRPSSLSCQDLAASDPQRTIVNRFSSMALLSYMSEIIEDKRITTHKTHFDAKKKYMRSEPYISIEELLSLD